MVSDMDHSNEIRARYATPCGEIRSVRGEDWSRTLQVICPVCGHAFYHWQPLARPCEPGYSDPEPEVIGGVSQGVRRTCGSTYCAATEDKHQLDRGGSYRKACDDYTIRRKSESSPNLESKSGLKRAK